MTDRRFTKLSRRDAMKIGAGAAAAAAMPTTSWGAGENVLRAAFSAKNIRTLDPHYMRQGADAWTNRSVHNCLMDPPNGTFKLGMEDVQGELATGWNVSKDSRVWTLDLREGVLWHKGYGELTADDVVFSYQRMSQKKSRYSVFLQNMKEVKATGKHQVQFVLNDPDPTFHAFALISPMYVMSRKAVEKLGDDAIAKSPIGTGPFVFDRIDTDRGVLLTANPDYFAGRPAIDGVEFRYIPDTAARTLAFVKGDLDMIDGARQPGWIDQIKQQAPDSTVNATKPGSLITLHFNMTRKPFDDIRVRKAVRYAIDRNVFPQAFGSMCTLVWGINPTQVPGALQKEDVPEDLRYDLNIEKSKALLAEAGYPNGLEFEAFTSQREDYRSMMLLVQEMLRRANINMKLNIIDHTTFHNDRKQDKGLLMPYSKSHAPVPAQALFGQFASSQISRSDGSGGENHSHYGEDGNGIDDILEQVTKEEELAKRHELTRKAELKILEDMPAFTLTTQSLITVLGPRVDLGFEVEAGYPQYVLNKARLKG